MFLNVLSVRGRRLCRAALLPVKICHHGLIQRYQRCLDLGLRGQPLRILDDGLQLLTDLSIGRVTGNDVFEIEVEP